MATRQVRLPHRGGGLEAYTLGAPSSFPRYAAPPRTRIAYAAAHVVCDPLADTAPWVDSAIDWDATLAYRHHL
ncbi:MAG TPA: DUF993 family protein, partial [Chloroflexota bacterium]|nr:DUF993 family protein [Chloroflexota bacterium]